MSLDGRKVLYPFLQKDLLEKDVWLFQMLTARLVISLGVWLSPEIYQRYPLLVPYAVRDPLCRGNKKMGLPDEWGSADTHGHVRDDNSLIKGVPDSLSISAPIGHMYAGKRAETGFVAAHVWRETDTGVLASRRRETYSFVPNLVWLPADVAKLSDREGSFVQSYLQALSRKIYSHRDLSAPLQEIVEPIWNAFPVREHIPEQGLPDLEELNFFEFNTAWLVRRQARLKEVTDLLINVRAGKPGSTKVVAGRYAPTVGALPPGNVASLTAWLSKYQAATVAPVAG